MRCSNCLYSRTVVTRSGRKNGPKRANYLIAVQVVDVQSGNGARPREGVEDVQ